VILLVIAVIGGTWWKNTRHMDFLTPPSDAQLQAVRMKVEAALPKEEQPDAISIPKLVKVAEPVVEPPPPPVEPPKPNIDLGDLTAPPALQNYAERTPQGADHLIELARALQEKGEPQRALLAWERVIDLTKPDPTQAATALAAIRQLRSLLPVWNPKPETAIQITLHASTGKKQAKALTPLLETTARDIEAASSGILKIKTSIKIGKTNTKSQSTIALWLKGPNEKSTSTEVISFTVDSPENLKNSLLRTVYQLSINHFTRFTAYTPPASLTAVESPQDALTYRITRLCWNEFAAALNAPAKKAQQ
jgi:hypothetical protein